MVMDCLLVHPHSLCNPLLWDAESVHPESFDVEAKLGCGPEIGYV